MAQLNEFFAVGVDSARNIDLESFTPVDSFDRLKLHDLIIQEHESWGDGCQVETIAVYQLFEVLTVKKETKLVREIPTE